jgi:hypothetical protein
MSGFSVGGSDVKKKFEQILTTPFFTFSKPYLEYIGKGKIFNLLYVVMAAISLLLPFVIIVMVAKSGIFQYGGAKYIGAFIFSWLFIAFACWIGFQLWWDRRSNVSTVADSEFVATPVFSGILQTAGEWLGTLIGIIGAGVGLVAAIFLGDESSYLFRSIGLGFLNFGAAVIIIGPVIGFFIIIITRFLAEQLRLFAALANNTKDIAANVKR